MALWASLATLVSPAMHFALRGLRGASFPKNPSQRIQKGSCSNMKSHIRASISCKVSFHGGRKYNLKHNHRTYDRDKWIKDGHIDYKRTSLNEILVSKNLKEFFDEEFGEALVASDKANEKKHPDRVWGISRKEYEKIKKEEGQERADEVRRKSAVKGYYNSKKREVQEFIIQLGNHEDYLKIVEQYGQEKADEFYRSFLIETLEDFQKENPQLVVFDASLHFDETVEGSPHIHIDTLPVAESKQGLKKKVSLDGALKMQGYDRKKLHTYDDTPYKTFLRTYREHLEELGKGYADIIPSEHTGRQHTPTNVWRNKKLNEENQKLEEARDEKVIALATIEPQPEMPPPLVPDEPRPTREHRGYTREEEKELQREQKAWDKRHATPNVFNPKGGERYQAEQEHALLTEQRKKERDEWKTKNEYEQTLKRTAERQKQTAVRQAQETAKLEKESIEVKRRERQAAQQIKMARDAQFAAVAQREVYALERVPLSTAAEILARNEREREQQQISKGDKQQW